VAFLAGHITQTWIQAREIGEVITAVVMNIIVFRDVTSRDLMDIASSTLKVEITGFSETLVNIYKITGRHIPEHNNLHAHTPFPRKKFRNHNPRVRMAYPT
jgi:hypothetical protein